MEVIVTDTFKTWYEDVLDEQAGGDVYKVVGLLQARGVGLGLSPLLGN